MSKAISDITSKTDDIQKQVNQAIQSATQQKLLKIQTAIAANITKKINDELNGQIKSAIENQLNDYISHNAPQYATNNAQAPVPGVFPVETKISCDGMPPLNIKMQDITIDLNENFSGWDDQQIPIPWPPSLKKFQLSRPFEYSLPKILLSQLSYSKQIDIRLPGLQTSTFTRPKFSIVADININGPSGSESPGACISEAPKGNACSLQNQHIQFNNGKINDINSQIQNTSQNIANILQ